MWKYLFVLLLTSCTAGVYSVPRIDNISNVERKLDILEDQNKIINGNINVINNSINESLKNIADLQSKILIIDNKLKQYNETILSLMLKLNNTNMTLFEDWQALNMAHDYELLEQQKLLIKLIESTMSLDNDSIKHIGQIAELFKLKFDALYQIIEEKEKLRDNTEKLLSIKLNNIINKIDEHNIKIDNLDEKLITKGKTMWYLLVFIIIIMLCILLILKKIANKETIFKPLINVQAPQPIIQSHQPTEIKNIEESERQIKPEDLPIISLDVKLPNAKFGNDS